ncbi:hypothetical protein K505DRAFT_282289 [Melanomma pulvis-pyrius CBS 109.77]|uniref:Rhodopsin domain-containing protein n=1 Tax=Melanomma pulvis-pyrius CBS 109.77 TaxID=1314802 RepID=A0A6A6X335_9PLEO|nr:hypothetical protein K505DRAFT_282289 [Melanomma pulvis-pyrius CBS 109.77]
MVDNRQTEALVIVCLFTILAAIFVGARAYSRYLGRNPGWDDWLIYVALLLLLGETVTIYQYIILSHSGYHKADVPKQTIAEQVTALQWSFAVQLFYHPMMGAIRASIIMFLFRVKDHRTHIQVALHIVFWINIGYMVSTTFVNIFQCTPIRYAYAKPEMDQVLDANGVPIKHGKCINSLAFILASCALSIFMDLIIIPIPTAMVWNLQMRTKTKIAVVIIMSMGWIATAVTVGRFIVYYYRFSPKNKDKTYDIGLVISIVEPAVGIIAACAPAMKCLFRFTDDTTSYPTPVPTKNESVRRRSFTEQYGMGKEYFDNRTDEMGREEEVYGMNPLGNTDSRDRIVSITANTPTRSRSTKTGHSEALEHMPEHCLDETKL